MSDASPVNLSAHGPPETILPPPDPAVLDELAVAVATSDLDERRAAVGELAARHPRLIEAWAVLYPLGRTPVERYAYARVGYHRGLDALRGAGWRGSGPVRWRHVENQGFLTCLEGLAVTADEIDETDEAERCQLFLRQLDPSWPPADRENA